MFLLSFLIMLRLEAGLELEMLQCCCAPEEVHKRGGVNMSTLRILSERSTRMRVGAAVWGFTRSGSA